MTTQTTDREQIEKAITRLTKRLNGRLSTGERISTAADLRRLERCLQEAR